MNSVAPPPVPAWPNAEDVADDIIDSLARYLRCHTVTPPGQVGDAVALLAGLLAEHGIETTIIEPFAGKPILVARLAGETADQGLILLSHSDVVPADGPWTHPPFSGQVADGFIWGRGALDMKAMGIMQLWAMVLLRRAGVRLAHDVTLIVVPDEEQGGAQGAEWLTRERPDLCRGRWLLNEGGMGLRIADSDQSVFLCSTGEKGPVWIKLSAEGKASHSAIPTGHNALEILTAAIARVLARPQNLEIQAHHYRTAELLGVPPETTNRLYLRPQLSDTISLTMLNGGTKQNVIPETASAVIDCRLLPERSLSSFLADLRGWLADDRVAVEVLVDRCATASPVDSALVTALRHAIGDRFPAADFLPMVAPYFTDSMFFRKLGIECFGLMPILLEEDDLGRIHGRDERISVENVIRGTDIIADIALRLCG